ARQRAGDGGQSRRKLIVAGAHLLNLLFEVLERVQRRVGLVTARVDGLGALAQQLPERVELRGVVGLNAVGKTLNALGLLAGDGDGRVRGARAQQPRVRADADDRGNEDHEEGREQLVSGNLERKGLEQVDALEVLDRVAHLRDRQGKLFAAGAELESRR